MKVEERKNISQQSESREPNGSLLTTADVIQLDYVLLQGGLNEVSAKHESLVQGL